ncbi:hypothetical protein [Portibacter marinus]|uniref:hypothetical protein n=1 Tax=Portibacter marinus TaxID=2898660 RepID=UPI001F45B8C2|nr:hypothetical protein [Portibacter marinus]
MTEQSPNVTDAVSPDAHEQKIAKFKKEQAEKYLLQMERHLKRISSLHLYGSNVEEVNEYKTDSYFSSWFKDAENGDIHAMHSILDHFEPLQIITNMGHNYRSRFANNSAEIILDFRPGTLIPNKSYSLEDAKLKIKLLEEDEKEQVIKSYLYSTILRIAKELMLFFPLQKISFSVNCKTLKMRARTFQITKSQVSDFADHAINEKLLPFFEDKILVN